MTHRLTRGWESDKLIQQLNASDLSAWYLRGNPQSIIEVSKMPPFTKGERRPPGTPTKIYKLEKY